MRDESTPRYPMPRRELSGPPTALAELREAAPLSPVRLWNGTAAWLVTRFADAMTLLADPRLSSDPRGENFPLIAPNYSALAHQPTPGFTQLDDPEHARLRRIVAPEFTARRVARLRPWITEVADNALSAMRTEKGPTDLVTRFAVPIPTMALARILGVPYADHSFFLTRALVRFRSTATADELIAADDDLRAYIHELATQRLREPQDDLLSRMASMVHQGQISREELAGIGSLLLFNGYLTTANLIALSAYTVLTDDQLRGALRKDAGLIAAVVDELSRMHTIGDVGLPRLATADIEVSGMRIEAGEAVIISLVSANRDPRVFEAPEVFDPHREYRRNLTFGHGSHVCLGVGLARAEVTIALETLLRGDPTPSIAVAPDQLETLEGSSLFGIRELPVCW